MSTNIRCTLSGALALVSLMALADTPPLTTSGEFLVHNARIFDGSKVILQGDVWVCDGQIRAVGRHLKGPSSVRVIDGTGKTLLPGLIDAHVHAMGLDTALRSALALGVTTEFDMGASPRYAARIKAEQAAGNDLDLADLFSSRTQPTVPDGHGTEYGIPIPTLSTAEEAQGFIDARIAEGADFIGEIIYDDGREFGLQLPTLSRETLRAVIEAAHRRGKLAIVHVLSLQGAKDAIAAGADGLAHLFTDAPPDEEFLALAKQHHPFVIATLSVLAASSGASAGPALAQDPRIAPYLAPDALADLQADYPRHAGEIGNALEAVRRLQAAGVPILAGTDAHNLGTAHGASLLGELQLLVSAGLTPIEALASATSINASAFGLSDRGRIAPGRRADLLMVAGNPTAKINDIRNVIAVWKLGVQDDRDNYRAQLNAARASQLAARRAPAPAGSESGLISDFEDGSLHAAFGMGWSVSTGSLLGGRRPTAQLSVIGGGANGSAGALQITGDIAPGIFGWAGALFLPGTTPMAPVNLSGKRAISFWAKGDGRIYQLMVRASSKGAAPLTKAFVADQDWQRITITFAALGIDGSDLQAISIAEVGLPGHFSLLVDDIRLEP
jgi:imidazolonepropionase-like amidohydrolase